MSVGDSRSQLQDLPTELIEAILAECSLEAAVALSQVSSLLRSVCCESLAWSRPLLDAAETAGAHLLRPPYHSPFCADLLASAAGRAIPPRTFIPLLRILSRHVLRTMELPRLRNSEWKEICHARFLPGAIAREVERHGEDDGSLSMKGRWREVFLKLIGWYEHRDLTACAQEDHSCQYVVLHRKAGLTRNRISTREYDPLRVFEELKRQNSLAHYTTVQITIPARLVPVDVVMMVYVTIGRIGFLSNGLLMDVLEKLGAWKRSPNTAHAILGPALITATIRPSPETLTRRSEFAPHAHISLDIEDFFAVSAKSGMTSEWWEAQCEVKDGFGYR